MSTGAIWTDLAKRPRASRGISRSVGSLISQAWSPNPPQMAPDGQIKQLTGLADGSYLLMHCCWWRSHTFFTRLVRGFYRAADTKTESLSKRRFTLMYARVDAYPMHQIAHTHTCTYLINLHSSQGQTEQRRSSLCLFVLDK